jgi:lysophospholipase L1-like esterase
VVNRGSGGEQSWELLRRFDRDVTAAGPRAVIIWGHINDVFRTPRDSIDAGLARARESYAEMVRKARAAGIEPILATEITARRPAGAGAAIRSWIGRLRGRESYDAWVNRHVIAVNDWLRSFAGRENVLLLDLQPVLADAKGRRRAATARPDGVHVSEAGYQALTAYAVPVLERHLAAAQR